MRCLRGTIELSLRVVPSAMVYYVEGCTSPIPIGEEQAISLSSRSRTEPAETYDHAQHTFRSRLF